MKEINLEIGMPYVNDALSKMKREIDNIKKKGGGVILIIHGYGSTGRGGAIREACREELTKRSDIKKIVFGEDFKILNRDAFDIKQKEPKLEYLFHMTNKGVTVIEV